MIKKAVAKYGRYQNIEAQSSELSAIPVKGLNLVNKVSLETYKS